MALMSDNHQEILSSTYSKKAVMKKILITVVLGFASATAQAECGDPAGPKVNWAGCFLKDQNLAGKDLSGANLNGAFLTGANLSGANLSGANLIEAHVNDANLNKANLTGANASEAWFTYSDLAGANLSNTNLTKTILNSANLQGANLGGANLTSTKLNNAVWTDGKVCAQGSNGQCHNVNQSSSWR
jgi:uncharacterized protein YjbI with pentapeptide repeats